MLREDAYRPGYAWYVTMLLSLMYVFSFVDRLILGLLSVDIGRDLRLSDPQLALLIGTSFAVTYSLMGLPLAHQLDRGSRKWLVIAGVSVWGLCTIAAGFATGFVTLAATRMGVAAGEAVLTPAAVSLIADLFPRDRRATATVAYSAVPSLMTVGGLAIGAAALQFAQFLSPMIGLAPWRLTLVLVGLPPLVVGIVFACTTHEPNRGTFDTGGQQSAATASVSDCLHHLRRERRFYGAFYLASALFLLFVYGFMTWSPALLIRGYGWQPASAGYAIGAVGIAMGLLGLIVWPRVVGLLTRRGVDHPLPLAVAIGCTLALPAALLLIISTTNPLLFIALGLANFAAAAFGALSPLTIQHYAPPTMRARFMSLLLLAQSLIGYGLGPTIVASAASRWPGDDRALGFGLAAVALVAVPAAVFCYWQARRALMRRAG